MGQATGDGIAAEKRGDPKRPNHPSKNKVGLDASRHAHLSLEGTGESFLLDILFHRISEISPLSE
jgi:hypothetical protein